MLEGPDGTDDDVVETLETVVELVGAGVVGAGVAEETATTVVAEPGAGAEPAATSSVGAPSPDMTA